MRSVNKQRGEVKYLPLHLPLIPIISQRSSQRFSTSWRYSYPELNKPAIDGHDSREPRRAVTIEIICKANYQTYVFLYGRARLNRNQSDCRRRAGGLVLMCPYVFLCGSKKNAACYHTSLWSM